MYKEYKQLDLSQIGKEVLDFWKQNNIFEKSVSSRPESKPYTFYEGPPSANGMPGIHHVMARSIKDIFCRYKTLKGYQVKRKGGWDTHGLPIELAVEKSLGITKDDIGKKISIEDYNAACRKEVMKYNDVWNDLTEKMSYWVDLEDPYITYKNEYIESLWWILSQLEGGNIANNVPGVFELEGSVDEEVLEAAVPVRLEKGLLDPRRQMGLGAQLPVRDGGGGEVDAVAVAGAEVDTAAGEVACADRALVGVGL